MCWLLIYGFAVFCYLPVWTSCKGGDFCLCSLCNQFWKGRCQARMGRAGPSAPVSARGGPGHHSALCPVPLPSLWPWLAAVRFLLSLPWVATMGLQWCAQVWMWPGSLAPVPGVPSSPCLCPDPVCPLGVRSQAPGCGQVWCAGSGHSASASACWAVNSRCTEQEAGPPGTSLDAACAAAPQPGGCQCSQGAWQTHCVTVRPSCISGPHGPGLAPGLWGPSPLCHAGQGGPSCGSWQAGDRKGCGTR